LPDGAETSDRFDISISIISANVCTFYESSRFGENFAARRNFIMNQMEMEKIDIGGFQETRSSMTRIVQIGSFFVISSSAAAAGRNYGVEIWIHNKFKIAGVSPTFNCFTMIHSEPQILLISMQLGDVLVFLLNFHAPQAQAKNPDDPSLSMSYATRRKWWRRLLAVCKCIPNDGLLYITCDANSTIGSHATPVSGTFDGEDHNVNTDFFTDFLQALNMFLPATFDGCHSGPSVTHHTSHNVKRRIDYIAVKKHIQFSKLESCVADLDLSLAKIDHLAPLVRSVCTLASCTAPLFEHRTKICNVDLLNDAGCAYKFCESLEYNGINYMQNSFLVCQELTDTLRSAAESSFPLSRSKPRDPWVSPVTWGLTKRAKARLRDKNRISSLVGAYQRACIFYIFCAACGQSNHASINRLCDNINTLMQHTRSICTKRVVLSAFRHNIKWASINDWSDFATSTAIQADRAASKPNHDSKLLFGLTTKLSKKSKRVPKALKRMNGEMATDLSQVAHRWSQYFQNLFLGRQSNWEDLYSAYVKFSDKFPSIDIDDPSNFQYNEVVDIFRHLKRGKAFGRDALPPDLYCVFAEAIACIALPLYRQAFASVSEPLQFKGGVIQDLLKANGFATECNNSRGILVSDVLGKGYRRGIRNRLAPFCESFSLDTQCGSLLHKGTDFASHLLNSFLDIAKLKKRSAIVLFIDVIAAFDSVIHSFLCDIPLTDEAVLYLIKRLNLPGECYTELCEALKAPSVLKEAKVPDHLHNVAVDILENNWFLINNNPNPSTVNRSTKQGDPLADLFFNFFMARILKNIRNALHASGYGLHIPEVESAIFGHTHVVDATDVSYVDDSLFVHDFQDNLNVTDHIQNMVSIVCRALFSHCLVPNFKKGKSEVILALRGMHAKQAKKHVFFDLSALVRCQIYANHVEYVHVVPTYKHLGNHSTSTCNNMCRAKYRVSEAMASYKPLSTHVINSKHIALNTRTLLANSLIFTRLYFNICTWSCITSAQMSLFQNFHMIVLRSIYGFNHKMPTKDLDIQKSVNILPPYIAFRLKRLIYLPRLINYAPLALKASIAILQNNKDSWYNLITEDLLWLASQSQKMSGFVMSDFLSESFQSFLFSSAWKTAVYSACDDLLKQTLAEPSIPSPVTATFHPVQCKVCSTWLRNSHQLSGHLGRVHKIRHISRIYAHNSGVCRICLKGFHNRARLIHHLRQSSYTCLMQYEVNSLALTQSQITEFDLEDRIAAAAAKRSGFSKLHAVAPMVQFSGPLRPLIYSCLTSMHGEPLINAVP